MGATAGFDGCADLAEALGDGARGGDFAVLGCCGGVLVGVEVGRGRSDGRNEEARRKKEGEEEHLRHAAEIALVSAVTAEVSRIL